MNVKEINAFALPGGPMFVNRGMIEAAHTDGEVAGVMAHELSHVLLRHGTAQASKATKYEVGQVAGAVLGAIIGGGWGQVISQGTQFGLGTAFLRFSREYEREADIEGAQIMARAGYDPNDMANMFKTIQKQGGSGGPQWLSDHPDPGDRSAYIAREAQIAARRESDSQHAGVRAGAGAPEADVAGADHRAGDQDRRPHRQRRIERRGAAERTGGTALVRASRPTPKAACSASACRPTGGSMPGTNAVTFAPEGAYGDANGQSVFTHGVEVGSARNESARSPDRDRRADGVARGRAIPDLSRPSGYDRVNIGGRQGLRAVLSNTSSTGQPENIVIFTSQLRDGSLFYAVAVAPRGELLRYSRIFDRVISSIQLID